MGARAVALRVHRRGDAQDAQQPEAAGSQSVRQRLDGRRQLVGRVVVDEDDLVIGIGQDFRETVQAERDAPVVVVSVRVVAPVDDHRDHGRLPAISGLPRSISRSRLRDRYGAAMQ